MKKIVKVYNFYIRYKMEFYTNVGLECISIIHILETVTHISLRKYKINFTFKSVFLYDSYLAVIDWLNI